MNTKLNYFFTFTLIIILIFIIYNLLKNIYCESFSTNIRHEPTHLFKIYNEKIYPFMKKISHDEQIFIEKTLNNMNTRDIRENKHISPYSFSFCIDKNKNKTNYSRFNIGNKSNQNIFKKDVKELLDKLEIRIDKPQAYNWYGIGWDLEENIIKIHMINKRNKKIICYVYDVERGRNNNVKNTTLHSSKTYLIGVEKTTMLKQGKSINQFNIQNNFNSKHLKIKYPETDKIIKDMNKKGFDIDSYSEYDNKLNLYFD